MGGRLRVASSPSRSRPARSARCIGPRWRRASRSSSRCSARTRATRSSTTCCLLELFAEKAMARPGLREVIDIPALVEHLSESLRRELDFRLGGRRTSSACATVLEPYDRLAVPRLYPELSTARLLVMEGSTAARSRSAPDGEARREAARQLLESYYRQVLTERLLPRRPAPREPQVVEREDLLPRPRDGRRGRSRQLRELMLLLLLAFWRDDAALPRRGDAACSRAATRRRHRLATRSSRVRRPTSPASRATRR